MAACTPSYVQLLSCVFSSSSLIQMGKRKCRDGVSERTRYEKRIQRSLDTLLRAHVGLPIYPKLNDPRPCSTVEVKAFLWEVAHPVTVLTLYCAVLGLAEEDVRSNLHCALRHRSSLLAMVAGATDSL